MKTPDFIKMAQNNEELCKKLQACKAPEEAYNIAKAEGVTDSLEEFTAEMTKSYDSVRDLNEDDLAKVAGGNPLQEWWEEADPIVKAAVHAVLCVG